ncbi:winged helix-turn-helix domain-containing protein [Roseateles sp. BYS96W]|uniref:Winged helix-turn-helix domain-containing protein n=1 Tax=Pelomonas nitida TaxID=3299027 RepID=A0ABW7G8P0_9BURK
MHPATQRLSRDDETVALEPRMMAVLVALCRRPGEVVSAEALLQACWPGEALGDNPVHKVIAGLRRALRDSVTQPQYIETIRRQGYRLLAPVQALAGTGPRGLEGSRRGRSPYCGLAAFGPEQADVFFGRDEQVTSLHERLLAQWRRGYPQVVLLGPSGSGKTSLVQAGLLPALLAAAGDAAPGAERLATCAAAIVDLGGAGELGLWPALAGTLLDWDVAGTPLLSGWSMESLAPVLQAQPQEVARLIHVGLRGAYPTAIAEPPPPLLVLDRLEALLLLTADDVVRGFLACIDALVRAKAVLLVAICRNDFYARLARHPTLLRDKEHGAHMDLPLPSTAAIAQMIRLPARAGALVFGTDPAGLNRLDDRLCADALNTRDALPLLQYTLQELYLQREAGDELSWAAYAAMGGLEGAIGRRAEAALAELPAQQQAALTRLLPRLVGLPTEDAPPTGRWLPEQDLADDDERALVQALVQSRLLVADQLNGQPGCRVVHEAVLRSWPRVTAWLAQHRATLAMREQLLPWVQRWREGGRANALLLPRGAMLWQAVAAIAEAPQLFGAEVRDCVARSQARLRRLARWRWLASAGVAGLALLTALAAMRNAELATVAADRARQSQRLTSFMLGDLADQLRPIGRLDLLGSVGRQSLAVLGAVPAPEEAPADRLQRAKALIVLAEVEGTRGKGDAPLAQDALAQAQRLLASLRFGGEVPPGDYFKAVGATAFWQGQAAFDQGDHARAAEAMGRYRDACEQWLRAVPGDAGARSELGFALNSLGSIALRRAAWADAERWFQQALQLKLALLAAQPGDVELQDAVASSRTWLGLLARLRGQPRAALALLDASRGAQLAMHEARPGEFVRLHDLGALQVRRAEAQRDLGDHAAAAATMGDATQWLARAAHNDPGNRLWRAELAHAEALRLMMQADAGQRLDAAQLARQLADVRREAEGAAEPLWQETLARLVAVQALQARARGDAPAEFAAWADARGRVARLLAQRPLNWQLNEFLARLTLLGLRLAEPAGTALPPRSAACAQAAAALQPSVSSGQAGLVREAWLAARGCSTAEPPAPRELQALAAGGYRPMTTFASNPH